MRLSPQVDKRYELLFPLLDLTTSLEPRFNMAYLFGSIYLAESPPGGPGRPDLGIALLESDRAWLERHSADGARAGAIADDLRVHRAGVATAVRLLRSAAGRALALLAVLCVVGAVLALLGAARLRRALVARAVPDVLALVGRAVGTAVLAVAAIRELALHRRAGESPLGIAYLAATAVVMFTLAVVKRRTPAHPWRERYSRRRASLPWASASRTSRGPSSSSGRSAASSSSRLWTSRTMRVVVASGPTGELVNLQGKYGANIDRRDIGQDHRNGFSFLKTHRETGARTCEIYLPNSKRPREVDDESTLILGHELLHCMLGGYHR